MAATERPGRAAAEQYGTSGPDRVVSALRFAIAFLIVCILSLIIYALLVGALMPPAPRTRIESALLAGKAAVQKSPSSGQAWSALAGAQYAGGDTKGAWASVSQARKAVTDHSILLVNLRELDFLLIEGKDAEAVKRADEFIKTEAKFQVTEIETARAKGIQVPTGFKDNSSAVKLFAVKAQAQGNLGKWKEAVATLDTALSLDDKAADLITLRGWAKLRAGNKKGAAKDFQSALKFLPGDESATRGLKESRTATGTK